MYVYVGGKRREGKREGSEERGSEGFPPAKETKFPPIPRRVDKSLGYNYPGTMSVR